MKLLLATLAISFCGTLAAPQPGWTAYMYTSDTPAVIKIAGPGLSFPQINTKAAPMTILNTPVVVPLPSAPTPLVKAAAPVPVVKTVPAPVPLVKSAPAAVAAPVVVAVPPEPLNAPEPPMPSVGEPFVGGQFHSQDELKQYSFGHWGGPNTRVEVKDSLDRVSGSFAYVNPKGDVQVGKYAAAPAMGFKVAASDLPEDTPAVAQIKAAHAQAHADAKRL